MTSRWSPKDPQDVRDYWIDFSSLLSPSENLSAAVVTVAAAQHPVTPPFDDLENVDDDITDTMVRVRLSGGVASMNYIIQYHVTTDTGQEFDLTKTLTIKERIA